MTNFSPSHEITHPKLQFDDNTTPCYIITVFQQNIRHNKIYIHTEMFVFLKPTSKTNAIIICIIMEWIKKIN